MWVVFWVVYVPVLFTHINMKKYFMKLNTRFDRYNFGDNDVGPNSKTRFVRTRVYISRRRYMEAFVKSITKFKSADDFKRNFFIFLREAHTYMVYSKMYSKIYKPFRSFIGISSIQRISEDVSNILSAVRSDDLLTNMMIGAKKAGLSHNARSHTVWAILRDYGTATNNDKPENATVYFANKPRCAISIQCTGETPISTINVELIDAVDQLIKMVPDIELPPLLVLDGVAGLRVTDVIRKACTDTEELNEIYYNKLWHPMLKFVEEWLEVQDAIIRVYSYYADVTSGLITTPRDGRFINISKNSLAIALDGLVSECIDLLVTIYRYTSDAVDNPTEDLARRPDMMSILKSLELNSMMLLHINGAPVFDGTFDNKYRLPDDMWFTEHLTAEKLIATISDNTNKKGIQAIREMTDFHILSKLK